MNTSNTTKPTHIHIVWAITFVLTVGIGIYAYKLSLDKAASAADRAVEEAHLAASRLVDETKNAANRAILESKHAVSAATAKAEQYAGELAALTERVAEKFKTGQITETFRAEIPVFRSAGIGILELGTAEVTETFKESNKRWVVWDSLYLGETVTEISVPVTYRYHVPLSEEWEIEVEDGNCIVKVPQLRPSLPVAIQTDKLRKNSSNGWARFDADDRLDELHRKITPTLNEYAARPEHLDLVREAARATVVDFISAWLNREQQLGRGRITNVTVLFPGETIPERPLLFSHELADRK